MRCNELALLPCTPDPQLQPQLSNQQFISLQIAIFLAKATNATLNLNMPMNSHRLHPLNIMSFERTKNLSWNRTTFPRIMSTCSLKRKQIMGSETGGILTNNCCYYPRGKNKQRFVVIMKMHAIVPFDSLKDQMASSNCC